MSLYGPGATRLHEEILTVTARWSEAGKRKDPIAPYARDAEARTLELLEEALGPSGQRPLPESLQRQLLESLPQDIEQLLPHLKARGEVARDEAAAALSVRGEEEASAMRKVLEDQRKRVLTELSREIQLDLLGGDQERRQYESNRRYWERWVSDVEDDLRKEPARIRTFYEVNSFRIEPVGIAYLYPQGT